MKFKSGRDLDYYGDLYSISPDLSEVTVGFDMQVEIENVTSSDWTPFTPEERRELAEEMISRWKKWAGIIPDLAERKLAVAMKALTEIADEPWEDEPHHCATVAAVALGRPVCDCNVVHEKHHPLCNSLVVSRNECDCYVKSDGKPEALK